MEQKRGWPQSKTNIHLLVLNSPAQPSPKLGKRERLNSWTRELVSYRRREGRHKTKQIFTFSCLIVKHSHHSSFRERAQTHELWNQWAMGTKESVTTKQSKYSPFLCASVHLKLQGHSCTVELVRQYRWLASGWRKGLSIAVLRQLLKNKTQEVAHTTIQCYIP